MMKNKSRITIFAILLLSMSLVNLFISDKTFSDRENRLLSKLPEFSIKTLMDGTYNSNFEKYASDQFILRDTWTGIKTRLDLSLLKKDNTRIYYGKDNYLFDIDKPINEDKFIKKMNKINKLDNTINKPIDILLIPNKATIYQEQVPYKAPLIDDIELLSDIRLKLNKNINLVSTIDSLIKHNSEQLYYKTDHHYTTSGAYYTYKEYIESIGLEAYPLEDFDRQVVSDDFLGSLFRKSNYYAGEPERIEKFVYNQKIDLEIKLNNTDKTLELYDESYLSKSDKYSYFLGGDHPLLEITTTQKGTGTIVILKDSFANSMIPFLTLHFENLIVIDERYYNLPIEQVLENLDYDRLLYLFNLRTFYDQ